MHFKINHKNVLAIFAIVLALSVAQCSDKNSTNVETEKHWSYSGDTGPNYWSELNADYWLAAYGKNQSPINLNPSAAIKIDLPNIEFHYEASELEIENNGHTIEVIPQTGSYIKMNDMMYELEQFHFHSLSEHTVNGEHFPLEAHFVHKNADNDLAVVGVLVEIGEMNAAFQPIWEHLPAHEEEMYNLHTAVNADDLLPMDRRSYQYSGSLTTPPCSEGVSWFVLAEPVEMSQAQLDAFTAIYNDNYRPVQPQNARYVLLDTSN